MKYVLTMEFDTPQELRGDFSNLDLTKAVANALGLSEMSAYHMTLHPKGTPLLGTAIRVPFPRCTREKPL